MLVDKVMIDGMSYQVFLDHLMQIHNDRYCLIMENM